jgi:type IV pilus assembly protein PilN
MTRINLLPWREKYIDIQNRRFGLLCVLTILLSFIVCLVFKFMFSVYLIGMVSDKNYLQQELMKSESKMQEVSSLLVTKNALLKRIKIIEKLQVRRNLGTEILDGIATALPASITLFEISCKDDNVKVSGVAENNEDISIYMNNIEKKSWVNEAALTEIKNNEALGHDASTVSSMEGIKFTIDIKLKVTS